jgi:citrate lyase subunit beta/citryl-CoA lyase
MGLGSERRTDWDAQLLRSLLFAPGNKPRKLAKVGGFGVDAVVLDLEDAVPVSEKVAARSLVAEALPAIGRGAVCVRVNSLQSGLWRDELEAVVSVYLHALLIPKIESGAALAEVNSEVTRLEAARGLATGSIRLLPLI